MDALLEVELAAVDAWAEQGVVPEADARECREKASFTVEAVDERERPPGHDVAAFVDVVAASIGDSGRWLHYGLTSYDVVDNALALQLKAAGSIIIEGASAYRDALVGRAREFADVICVGRTHGVHAEPTTFGLKLASLAFDADRNLTRLKQSFDQVAVGKVSGAVGTYASVPPAVENQGMERRGRAPEGAPTHA